MNSTPCPIALFTYNRPDHARRVLESLSHCCRLDECQLYIYCDGAKDPSQVETVSATRQVVKNWAGAHQALVIERDQNMGVDRSIVTAVTELCQEFGRVIVVEDDLVLGPDFLAYMLQSLDRYENDTHVYQISGYMYPIRHPRKPDAFFLPFTTSWGWATWERAWRIFDWHAPGASQMVNDALARHRFDLDGSYPYTAMLQARLSGKIDAWDIVWYFAVFNAGGLVLFPRQSLVWNGGWDGSGTHTDTDPNFRQISPDTLSRSIFSTPLQFPGRVVLDQEAFEKVKKYLVTWQRGAQASILTKIRLKIFRVGRILFAH